MKLIFSISTGKLYASSSSFSMSIPASSGNGDCMNNSSLACQATSWEGAIPMGTYTIFSSEISNPGVLGFIARSITGDWGSWRVPLHPNAGTNTYGRSGFFIHGGSNQGSAGCIDVGGGQFGSNQTDTLRVMLEASGVITLRVIE